MPTRPDLSGFDVIIPPSIDERIKLPWDHEFSVPKRELRDGKYFYTLKPKVYRIENGYWKINITGIINSELPDTYATREIAYGELDRLLKSKPS